MYAQFRKPMGNIMPEAKQIIVAGEAVMCPQPYEPGHPLTEAEAKALNQVYSENVRNNTAARIKKAKEEGGDVAAAVAEAEEYARNYEFSMPSTGTSRRVMDPVEREARSIARELIKSKLEESGRKLKDVDKEKLDAKIDEVAANEDVLKLARKRVSEKKKLADVGLQGLDAVA